MVCRVLLEKARKLPSLVSFNKFKPLRAIAQAGLVLGLSAAAFAADYTADVEYADGNLYYTVTSGRNNLTRCTSLANGISFSTVDAKNVTINLYTNRNCNTPLTVQRRNVTIKGADLFKDGATSATATLGKDGKLTLEEPGSRKTIAFFTPWSNTNAILFMNGDSVGIMQPIKNYCGWFAASVKTPENGLKVYFKQTVGRNYVGAEGVTITEPTIVSEISLDSIASISDTIWVQGYKADVPALFSKYPGVLGDCPLKKFPVTVFDWLHGDKGDGDDPGKNGDPANGVSADFGSGGCGGSNNNKGYMGGMVQKNLGPNGVPVPADPFPGDCKITTHLANWFLPEVVATDAAGTQYTNMTCRDIYISMDKEGFWLAEVSSDNVSEGNDATKGGMFLVDDFEFLDDAKTVKNPYFDQLGNGQKHNFGFAVKIQATFEYVPGQYFDFYGDDDVWVFIDNRLAVDIGGQHRQVAGAVDLDTMGLVEGTTYDFHIFYVERHTSSSNFRMRTSIDLQVDASIFVTSIPLGDETNYKVWQVNKKNKLSCGYDANSTETDTTGGASTFKLTGGNLSEPQILDVGLHYEGLNITSDSTFSVNVEAIKANGALAPGHYFLEITLKSDPSQTTKVEITVPAYDLPSVAFAKEDWTVLGTAVSGDTTQIGEWAYATYQVNITFFEEWATVNNYNRKINLSFSDVNIDILDTIGGKKITSVNLDSNGRASFYVHANAPVTGATLTIKGAAAGSSAWTKLNFADPPIPQIVTATIFDRNGDGRADSLYAQFDRSLSDKSRLDSIQFEFGEAFMATGKFRLINNNTIVLTAEDIDVEKCTDAKCGFGSRQFTGGATNIYTGSLNNWFTYKDNGKTSQFYKENEPISDGMGPIIVSAVKSKSNDGNRHLALTFSEAISDDSRIQFATMFEFICMRGGINEKPETPVLQSGSGNTMTLVYSSTTQDAVLPNNGDLIRFVPGNGSANETIDLVGNAPHKDSAWVTITGDQELTNESPGVISIGDDPYGIIKKDTVTQSLLITNTTQDAQQIGDSLGVQGSLIDYDISKIMLEETQKDINSLDAFIESQLGSTTTYDTTYICISEEEALTQVFADIRTGVVGENFGFSEATVIAIMEGTINESNYQSALTAEEKGIIAKLTEDNIEASRDTLTEISSISTTTQTDLFNSIRAGLLDEKLKQAGVSQTVIDAIKDGTLNEYNIEEFRNGSKSLIADDAIELFYRTRYYSQYGEYVGGTSKSIKCSDKEIYGEEGCMKNKGKIFLAWNMRSNNGRLVGTGVYIARLELKIIVNGKTTMHQTRDKLWGVRRGKVNKLGLEFGP